MIRILTPGCTDVTNVFVFSSVHFFCTGAVCSLIQRFIETKKKNNLFCMLRVWKRFWVKFFSSIVPEKWNYCHLYLTDIEHLNNFCVLLTYSRFVFVHNTNVATTWRDHKPHEVFIKSGKHIVTIYERSASHCFVKPFCVQNFLLILRVNVCVDLFSGLESLVIIM